MNYSQVDKFVHLIENARCQISDSWLNTNRAFFDHEYVKKFAGNLIAYYEKDKNLDVFVPYFSEEITPEPSVFFSHFEPFVSSLKDSNFEYSSINIKLVAQMLEITPFEYILLVMGQRQTSATIKTVVGLPLKNQELLESCTIPFNLQISCAVRSWEKHADRSDDTFWGEIKGSPQEKQIEVEKLIHNIIENHTWWNTFYHYKHGVVFEIRVTSGHGIRWSYKDKTLIGFLEPFL
jgi:hypothetical protein